MSRRSGREILQALQIEERTARLGTLLEGATRHFKAIMELLADWPPGPERDAALVSAAPLGEGWWPSSAIEDFGVDHPAWSLASRLNLDRPELPDLRSLPMLRVVRLHRHTELPDLEAVARLAPQLETLQVWNNATFDSLRGLSGLTSLTRLEIKRSGPLHEIVELPTRLEGLHLMLSGTLTSLAPLEGLTALDDLQLRGQRHVDDITPLAKCEQLVKLNLDRVRMRDVDVLANCRGLQELSLSGCKELRSIEGLRALPELRLLALDACSALEDVSALETLPKLEGLSIVGMDHLQDVSRIEALPSLTRLARTPSLLPWPFP